MTPTPSLPFGVLICTKEILRYESKYYKKGVQSGAALGRAVEWLNDFFQANPSAKISNRKA
jgi:hypothetical protein